MKNVDFNRMPAPKNQAECDHINAIREHERIHARWMNTSVFTEEGKQLRKELSEAGIRLDEAQRKAMQ